MRATIALSKSHAHGGPPPQDEETRMRSQLESYPWLTDRLPVPDSGDFEGRRRARDRVRYGEENEV